MGYVANRPIRIVRDGKPVDLLVGDPFPEAPQSPNFNALLRTHQIAFVPDEAALAQGGQPANVGAAQTKGKSK